MKILNKSADGLKRKYNVLIMPTSLDEAYNQELTETASQLKIAGFRPGKVPVEVVKRRYGEAVKAESRKNAIKNTAEEVIRKEAIVVSFNYNTKVVKEDENGLEFELELEVIPGIELKDISNIEITKYNVELTEDEQLEPVNRIRMLYPRWTSIAENQKIDEETLVHYDVVLEHNNKKVRNLKDETVFVSKGAKERKGYDSHFLDLKVGDTTEFIFEYPKSLKDKQLAGKKINHIVTIKNASKSSESKLDDELAHQMNMADLNELKEWSKNIAMAKVEDTVENVMKGELLEKMSAYYDFPVPENMIRIEHQTVINQIAEEAKKLNKKMTPEIIEECKKIAIQRIRLGFVVSEIARKEKIVVSQSEVAQGISAIASNYPNETQKIWDFYTRKENMSLIISPILEKKVSDYLINNVVKVKEEKCTLARLTEIDEEPFDFFKDGEDKVKEKKEEKKSETTKTSAKKKTENVSSKDDDVKEEKKAPAKKKSESKKVKAESDGDKKKSTKTSAKKGEKK